MCSWLQSKLAPGEIGLPFRSGDVLSKLTEELGHGWGRELTVFNAESNETSGRHCLTPPDLVLLDTTMAKVLGARLDHTQHRGYFFNFVLVITSERNTTKYKNGEENDEDKKYRLEASIQANPSQSCPLYISVFHLSPHRIPQLSLITRFLMAQRAQVRPVHFN